MGEEKKVELALIVSISELVLKHGVPLALQLVKDWNVENPTLEDIEQLKNRVPRPSTYFDINGVDDFNSSVDDV